MFQNETFVQWDHGALGLGVWGKCRRGGAAECCKSAKSAIITLSGPGMFQSKANNWGVGGFVSLVFLRYRWRRRHHDIRLDFE